MHIPDGILNPVVLGTAGAVSIVVLSKSATQAKKKLEQKTIPIMGVMAAFIFAAQMVNFPLLGAVASGHLIGAALVAILFGFWPATMVMATVVSIQAIVFQDGGITVLGVNLLNMAIIAPLVAYLSYKALRIIHIPLSIATFISSWLSVMVTALAAALELGVSDVVSYELAIKGLLFWHLFIGLGEGIITTAILPFAKRSSFDLLNKGALN